MNRIKYSLAAPAGLFVLLAVTLAAPLSPVGAADKEKGPRQFYLTKTTHDGSQALSACAAGYHMASLWEIFDPSNLRYDTELGFTQADSGSGPPSGTDASFGWIRTGFVSVNSSITSGESNCQAWTTASGEAIGTTVTLSVGWAFEASRISPWFPHNSVCSTPNRVWCVQD